MYRINLVQNRAENRLKIVLQTGPKYYSDNDGVFLLPKHSDHDDT